MVEWNVLRIEKEAGKSGVSKKSPPAVSLKGEKATKIKEGQAPFEEKTTS